MVRLVGAGYKYQPGTLSRVVAELRLAADGVGPPPARPGVGMLGL